MPVSISGTNGVTFPDSSLQAAAASPYVLKNRIINGDMRIDQRNAGASVTTSTTAVQTYSLDRWGYVVSQASKFTIQQNAGSVTPPVGFTNYLGCTSTAATSVGSSDYFNINQVIEGFNVADLGWGTANAQTVTLSFWVRSSLTGTFGGSLRNSALNRSYPYTYTISSANTWEQKSITIAGDTSGTWLTTNGHGIQVIFSLGMGSTFSSTANSWQAGNYASATGATSVVGTNGATFYITGVQLEIGTSATPFERRLYNQELANCQRYFYQTDLDQPYTYSGMGFYLSSTSANMYCQLPVPMRAIPSSVSYSTLQTLDNASNTLTVSSISLNQNECSRITAKLTVITSASATGRSCILRSANSTSGYLAFSAEL